MVQKYFLEENGCSGWFLTPRKSSWIIKSGTGARWVRKPVNTIRLPIAAKKKRLKKKTQHERPFSRRRRRERCESDKDERTVKARQYLSPHENEDQLNPDHGMECA